MSDKITKETLEELQAALSAEKEAKLMALADLENYRKRMERERQELITYSNLSILKAIADTLDDFERMITDLEQPGQEDKIDAFKTVFDKTKGILRDYSVEEIEVNIGDKLNPALMEAIGTVTVAEAEKANTVIHIAQKGYRLTNKDLVVRHARVIVGKLG